MHYIIREVKKGPPQNRRRGEVVLYGGSEIISTALWRTYDWNSRGNAKNMLHWHRHARNLGLEQYVGQGYNRAVLRHAS